MDVIAAEIMIRDLETAQKERFEKARDKYKFFTNEAEMSVFIEIQGMKESIEPRTPRRVGRYGRARVAYDE